MKKRLLMLTAAVVLAFGLVACGSSEEETYGGYTADTICESMESTAESLATTSADEAEYYSEYYVEYYEDELTAEMLSDWAEIADQTGELVAFSDFDIEKTGKTTTATLTMDFTERDAKLIYVFNSHSMELTSANCELVYSLGETMGKAGLNTLMGISIVFLVLILISLIISCFKLIPVITDKLNNKNKKNDAPQVNVAFANTAAPAATTAKAPETDDLELVAVIAAAIAASTGQSTDSFVVRSIKKRR